MDTIDRILELLEQKGVSGSKMSRDLGFSNAVFYQWKNRQQNPSADKVAKMADYFGVSVDYLLGKTDKKNSPVEITDEEARDEFVGFYGVIKKDLTEGDLEDIKKLMRLRAELNRSDKE